MTLKINCTIYKVYRVSRTFIIIIIMKERQAATDEMFEPLKRTIELLKTYDQEMPDEVHQQLQVTGGGGEGVEGVDGRT